MPQLQRQVKNYCQKHKYIGNNDQIGIELTEDKNLQYSIVHGTILNPTIDKKGNFSGLLFDKYDFEQMKFDIFDKNILLVLFANIFADTTWIVFHYLMLLLIIGISENNIYTKKFKSSKVCNNNFVNDNFYTNKY